MRYPWWPWVDHGVIVLILVAALVCLKFAPNTWLFIPMLLAALVIHLLVPYSLKRRLARYVADHDYLVCLECGYALRGLSESICPECGTPFDEAEVRVTWRAWLATRDIAVAPGPLYTAELSISPSKAMCEHRLPRPLCGPGLRGGDTAGNDCRVYRVPIVIPIIGILGVLFFTYLSFLITGIVDYNLSPRFRPEQYGPNDAIFFACFACACIFLILTRRMRVQLSSSGIDYRGIVFNWSTGWDEVTKVRLRGSALGLYVHTATSKKELWKMSGPEKSQLVDDLCWYIHNYAPHAEIIP